MDPFDDSGDSTVDTGFGDLIPKTYSDLQSRLSARKQKEEQDLYDLLKQSVAPTDRVSPTKAFAITALSLLPMMYGKYLYKDSGIPGGESLGAAKGAQVGGALGTSLIKSETEDAQKENDLAKLAATQQVRDISSLDSLEKGVISAGVTDMTKQEAYKPGGYLDAYDARQVGRRRDASIAEINARKGAEDTYSPQEIDLLHKAGVDVGPNISKSTVSQYQRAKELGGIDDRFNKKQDRVLAQLAIQGLEPVDPAVVPDPKDKQIAVSLYTANARAQDEFDQLEQGWLEQDKEKVNNALAQIAFLRKEQTGAGAAFTANEQKIYFAPIPAELLGPNATFSEYSRQRFLGLDPSSMIKILREDSNRQTLIGLKGRNYKPKGYDISQIPTGPFEPKTNLTPAGVSKAEILRRIQELESK